MVHSRVRKKREGDKEHFDYILISGVKVVVTSPECYEPYKIIDSCGISASSALDDDTLPGNVILDDDTYWAPAIRWSRNASEKIIKAHCLL